MDEATELNEQLVAEGLEDQEEEKPEFQLATVTEVTSTGIKLQIDGEDEGGDKEYKCNADVKFQANDRVKVTKYSGSYVVEFVVGTPNARYPIPAGGTDGQLLAKNGSSDFSLKWTSMSGVPSGGTAGQVLTKKTNNDFAVEWTTIENSLPTGGTSGQFLKKNASANYSCEWADVYPSGGSAGQVLTKSASGVEWAAVAASKLGSSTYYVQMNNQALVPSGNNITLGTSSSMFGGLSTGGAIRLGSSYGSSLGFFGTSPATQQTVSNSATVAQLITALKAYGLIR